MNIKLVGVTKKIKKNNVLENINFEFESGKIHGIFGGHNSGKSLLLNLISNFCSPTSGEILYDGVSKKMMIYQFAILVLTLQWYSIINII